LPQNRTPLNTIGTSGWGRPVADIIRSAEVAAAQDVIRYLALFSIPLRRRRLRMGPAAFVEACLRAVRNPIRHPNPFGSVESY
jgi:hypothetical protein